MALPTPVISDGDIVGAWSSSDESARLIWNTWSQDPIKAAVLQTMLLCLSNVFHYSVYNLGMLFSAALGQNRVCPLFLIVIEKGEEVYFQNTRKICDLLLTLNQHPSTWRTTLGNINVQ